MKDKLLDVLKEMCKRVNADYNKMDFKKPNWFLDYSWTEEEEKEFSGWLIKQLNRDEELRQELMDNFSWKDEKRLKKVADEFVFNYGWKLK